MSNFRHLLLLAAGLSLSMLLPSFALADGEELSTAAQPGGSNATDQSTANFDKTKRFLPGEEVVTTTGKKVKVWSTEGPVPVSRPPQPFQDSVDQRLPPNTNVIVDPEILERRRRGDSFDVNR